MQYRLFSIKRLYNGIHSLKCNRLQISFLDFFEYYNCRSIFSNCNMSRIIPNDFNYNSRNDILNLLFLASFTPNIIYSNSFQEPKIIDKTIPDSRNLPLYNLIHFDAFDPKLKTTLDVSSYFFAPEILRYESHCFDFELIGSFLRDCTSNVSTNTSLRDYDIYPYVFVDISLTPASFDQFMYSLPKMILLSSENRLIMYRNLNGILDEVDPIDKDRLLKILLSKYSYFFMQTYCSIFQEGTPFLEGLEKFKSRSMFDPLLESDKHLTVLEMISNFYVHDSQMFLFIHFWVCRHIIVYKKYSLIFGTEHFSGLLWWILIGEMEDIAGMSSLLKWCSSLKSSQTIEYIEKLFKILTGLEFDLIDNYINVVH